MLKKYLQNKVWATGFHQNKCCEIKRFSILNNKFIKSSQNGSHFSSVNKELEILTYFQQYQNIRQTAQNLSTHHTTVQPSQICKCLQEKTALEVKAKLNSNAPTLHNGRAVENEAFQTEIYDWIAAQRQAKIFVSIAGIIFKALFLDTNFNKGTRALACVHGFIGYWLVVNCLVVWQHTLDKC